MDLMDGLTNHKKAQLIKCIVQCFTFSAPFFPSAINSAALQLVDFTPRMLALADEKEGYSISQPHLTESFIKPFKST